ncbi:hypothetical protein [Rhodoluna lacicola]|jgi:hypothetical protein|uniref:ATP synthase protein I n=1 Tax=Rhodoluna lacicola TaxID=529884 RepID=A0A060JKX2_9MICO|nr:hypothetical protein [Rhodoluna lacicola]AIC47238.1 hypothetical protein Rhola_00004190 [Rhodoluna lacicola]BDS50134.1 hypothetical protein RKACHI23_03960 [Rhodoluna lacicola]
MSKASNNLFTRVLTLGSALIGAIAIIGGLVGYLVAGAPGLTSALIGAGLTLVFVTMTALSVWLGGKLPLAGFFGLVLGGWLVKMIGFALVIANLKGADFINGPVLFFTLVAAIIGTLAVDSVLVLKARIPVIGD